jgi:hypothetical protein
METTIRLWNGGPENTKRDLAPKREYYNIYSIPTPSQVLPYLVASRLYWLP